MEAIFTTANVEKPFSFKAEQKVNFVDQDNSFNKLEISQIKPLFFHKAWRMCRAKCQQKSFYIA